MAKFCGNCGGQLDDSAKVCGYCGVPFVDNAPSTSGINIPGLVSVTEKLNNEKTKKYIKLGAIVVAAVLVFSIGLGIISSFTGYKGTVRKVINAFEDYDMETLCECASALNYYSDDIEFHEESFASRVESQLDYYEGELGHSLKISYKILDSYKLDDRNTDAFLREFENSDIYVGDVEVIRAVNIEITMKGARREATHTTDDLLLIKEDGKWKVMYTYSNFF